jgi:hypothetical protein
MRLSASLGSGRKSGEPLDDLDPSSRRAGIFWIVIWVRSRYGNEPRGTGALMVPKGICHLCGEQKGHL